MEQEKQLKPDQTDLAYLASFLVQGACFEADCLPGQWNRIDCIDLHRLVRLSWFVLAFLRQLALALRSATGSFSSDANAAARCSACLFSCPTHQLIGLRETL